MSLDYDDCPWCDTCKQPAVWSETLRRWGHYIPEDPFIPEGAGPDGHEVTVQEWLDSPPGVRPGAPS